MRLIDEGQAIDAVCTACSMETDFHKCDGYAEDSDWCEYLVALRGLPSVDPVKQGRWIFSPNHAEGICTACNYKIYGRPYHSAYLIVPYNYCPNCGAKMDEASE